MNEESINNVFQLKHTYEGRNSRLKQSEPNHNKHEETVQPNIYRHSSRPS